VERVSEARVQGIDWLTPAARMPWTVSTPFRMRPNLEKLDPESPALVLLDDLAPAYARERTRVLRETSERALVGNANAEALNAICGLVPSPAARDQPLGAGRNEVAVSTKGRDEPIGSQRARMRAVDPENSLPLQPPKPRDSSSATTDLSNTALTPTLCEPIGSSLPLVETATSLRPAPNGWSRAAREGANLALQLQEDFVILKHEADTLRTEYLSVCFPSRWDPREKLGLDFSQIHAPVADNQMLVAAGPSIMAMAFMKQPMLRHVWLIVPSASLPQHPDQNDYSWAKTLADPAPLLPRLFFRVERQTTWPLPQFKRAVFFIRVMMSPLCDVLRLKPERARELVDALGSMTPAVVAYRGMTDAMPRLLAELETFA
jgi:hypothetical protein